MEQGTQNFGPGHPEYEQQKKKITQEGWEGNEEGGAAVVIGKKGEADEELARLLHEGRTETLEQYIKLHARVVVPKDFLLKYRDDHKLLVTWTPKSAEFSFESPLIITLHYVDRLGDMKKVSIKKDEVAELQKYEFRSGNIKFLLRDLGFTPVLFVEGSSDFSNAESAYESFEFTEIHKAKAKEWDF